MASTLSTRSNSPDEATNGSMDIPNVEPRAHEDAITAEDSNDVNDIFAGEEPAKKAKKKRKSKSQRTAVSDVFCQLQSLSPFNSANCCRNQAVVLKNTMWMLLLRLQSTRMRKVSIIGDNPFSTLVDVKIY